MSWRLEDRDLSAHYRSVSSDEPGKASGTQKELERSAIAQRLAVSSSFSTNLSRTKGYRPMTYQRVIPRDLFNEAKLLKCLGQLSLFILDGIDHSRWSVPEHLRLTHYTDVTEGFLIEQDESDGSLSCSNVRLTMYIQEIRLSSPYNCKDAYPLQFAFHAGDEWIEGDVFNDDGNFSGEFQELISSIEGTAKVLGL